MHEAQRTRLKQAFEPRERARALLTPTPVLLVDAVSVTTPQPGPIMDLSTLEVGLRLVAAAVMGVALGINRDFAHKPIGMRTLGLVALGAASVTVAAIEVPGMAEHPDALSRVVQGVIQGVMAGISFIGAGVVLRDIQARTVEGLTTAATVWVTAALGIACGLGRWDVVLIGTGIGLLLLAALRWVEAFVSRSGDSVN
jgi:putative Mg2+ transporter-C (MgtC) family protein